MDASTAAGWWGAVTGSVALLWDVIKWAKSGARLKVSASPNMQIARQGFGLDPKMNIVVNVRNVGDQSTTLTHFLGCGYQTFWSRIKGKAEEHFVVVSGPTCPIPFKLEPGGTWTALANQDDLVPLASRSRFFYLGVQHSMAEKPLFARVRLGKKANPSLKPTGPRSGPAA